MTPRWTIASRRERAQAALDSYSRTGSPGTHEEILIDLLTDLLHWTDGNGLDFENAMDHAKFHHEAEVQP